MIPLHFNPLPVDQPTTAAAARTQAIHRGDPWYVHPTTRRVMSAQVAASPEVCLHGEGMDRPCEMCAAEWVYVQPWTAPQ